MRLFSSMPSRKIYSRRFRNRNYIQLRVNRSNLPERRHDDLELAFLRDGKAVAGVP